MNNKTKTNKNRPQYYSVNLVKENGVFKVAYALKEVGVNQFASTIKRVNARDLARELNLSKLVIN